MSDGTDYYMQHMYQAMQIRPACIEGPQFSPAGLSLPVGSCSFRSCSTRSDTMNLARSIALRAAQKPTSPATHE